ncbi:MAG: hypothetical protein AMJ94_07705 [Deltaproteobacteria bacterium SM23_61]|nr:MAG: hypothetical protein AMJ94_07705 [Deltaproteobacteria bacterium SM23_61]
MEQEIIHLLKTNGPRTGSEIKEFITGDNLLLWQTCKTSSHLRMKSVGRRFLRLDRRVDGFARLSPSILREFLTYSVVGLAAQPQAIDQRAREIHSRILQVSRSKLELARSFADEVQAQLGDDWLQEQACFILAGDIVYEMAHDVPRPERSTGRLVRGSDIDLVVIVKDSVPDSMIERLDTAIYQKKYRALISPAVNEEIDYVVKKMERVREQVRFDSFKSMVACKILQEGMLIGGSEGFYREVIQLLPDNGVLEKLDRLQEAAVAFRKQKEDFLAQREADKMTPEDLYLFYPAEESEEFE